MTTGTLKFASLLIVILTGGGVAWQAQQGILQPPIGLKSAEKPSSDGTTEPDLLADLGDSTSAPDLTLGEPSAKESKSSGWDDAGEISPLQLAAGPGKYERKSPSSSSKSVGSPIPARKPETKSKPDAKSRKKSESKSEDIEADANPFADLPSKEPSSKSKTLVPIPEDVPVPEDEETPSKVASASFEDDAETAKEDGNAEESDPVLLVGHEEPKRSKERKPAKSKAKIASADDPFETDPFENAAPPADEGDAAKEADSTAGIELPADDQTDKEESFPTLDFGDDPKPVHGQRKSAEPEDNGDTDFGSDPTEMDSAPQLELSDPSDEPALDSSEKDADDAGPSGISLPTETDPFGAADPSLADPNLEEAPTETPDSRQDKEPVADDLPPRKSPRKKQHKDSSPTDPAPELLPVPAAGLTDEDQKSPAESLNTDLDEPRKHPRRTFLDEQPVADLEGGGLPDSSVPKGIQQPRLSIEKIAPKQAVLKQPLVYSVVIKNTGSADAHHVTVEDHIPKGTTLVGTSPQAELFDKRLVWKLGTLRPDEHKKISIKVIPEQQGHIGSVARVNFVAEIAADIEVTAPQLVLNVDSPSQVRLGDKLHMVFKVRNTGSADAENVVIRNIIPDGLRHPAGADLEYAMGTLTSQDEREIKLDLIATKNGKVVNKTVVTGDQGLKLEEDTAVEVIGEQLLLTRTGKNKVFVDKSAVFTSTIANEGTAPANKVSVAEVIPAGFEFVGASNHGEFDPATRAVTWTVGPIGPGEELKLSTQLLPKKTGDYRSTITVTGPAGSVATVDAELKVEGFPAVGVDSKMDTRLISVGEKATVRILCKNQGTALARNLVLSAELPPELKLVNSKGQTEWNQEGHTVTFDPIPALQPNETASFEIQVEGVAEGDTVIEVLFAADHLKRPLQRDETIRVAAGGE